jgi:hypothetical protein
MSIRLSRPGGITQIVTSTGEFSASVDISVTYRSTESESAFARVFVQK